MTFFSFLWKFFRTLSKWTIVSWLLNNKEGLFKAKLEELQVYLRHLPRCFAVFVSTDSERNSIYNWFSPKNWNLELCNLTYKSGYLQIFFLSSKVRVMYIVFFEAPNINKPWWHWIVVIAHVVFSPKSRLQCSWKSHSSSSFKQQQRHFFHDMFYV